MSFPSGLAQQPAIERRSAGSTAILACLVYVLWRPVSNGQILYPVMALLAVLSMLRMVKYRQPWPRELRVAAIVLACGAALSVAIGAARNNPGLAHQATVVFGGAAVWGSWALSLRRKHIRDTLIAITAVTLALGSLILLYIGSQSGLVPIPLPTSILESQAAGFSDTGESTAIRFLGLSTLTIVAPLCASALMVRRDDLLPPRALLASAACVAVLAGVASGRRGIAVVTVAAPFLAWGVQRLLDPNRRRLRIPVWTVIALPLIAPILAIASDTAVGRKALASVQDALSVFLGVGDSSGTDPRSDLQRTEQIGELLRGWSDQPVAGSGMGAVLQSGYTRSEDRPWMFELQYHQLLLSGGLVGVITTAVAVIVLWTMVRRCASVNPEHLGSLTAVTVATLALLLANASNPYLQAVGHQWGVALVVAVTCALLGNETSAGQVQPTQSRPTFDEHRSDHIQR